MGDYSTISVSGQHGDAAWDINSFRGDEYCVHVGTNEDDAAGKGEMPNGT